MTDPTPQSDDQAAQATNFDQRPKQPPTQAAEEAPESNRPPNGAPLLPTEEIASLQQERDELRDQLLRSRAEFSNFQKRVKQQAELDRVYAIEKLAKDLLDAIDNLERATEALRSSANEGITAGLDMVQKQLLGVLAKYGIEPIAAKGGPFDPNYHDALLQQPSAEHPEGTVVAELSKGYKIHDRVLRPSKVAVSVKPEGTLAEADS
jgi:molecular chaperone GrpE